MERAMLLDNTSTIDAHDVAIGECLANQAQGLGIEIGLGVCGTEDGIIDDQEIGVCGG
jgi:hypothetical protein